MHLMEAFDLGAQERGSTYRAELPAGAEAHPDPQRAQTIREAIVQGHVDARAALELVRIHNKLAQNPGPTGSGALQRSSTSLSTES